MLCALSEPGILQRKHFNIGIEINQNNKPAMAGIALDICGRKFPVKFGDDINDNEAFSTPRLATDKDVAPG